MMALPLTLILAEDDPGHASLMLRNLKRAGLVNELVHVPDGQELLDYVRCAGAYAGRTAPRAPLILLDLNMPRVGGVEALTQLKGDEATRSIPVIILSTTDNPREIEECYRLGCNVYITKPVEYASFANAIQQIGIFLQFVQLPTPGAAA